MFRSSSSWFLILLVGVIAVLALPRAAVAQGISMAQYNPVVRVNDKSTNTSTTDTTIKLTITHDDCLNDKLKFKFSVAVPGYQQNYDVEAWAGRGSSNCASEYTAVDSVRTCWKLGNLSVTNAVATGEFTAAQLLGIGASSGKRILTNSCDDQVEGKGRQNFTVTFMFTYSSTVPASTTQAMYYSLVGPDAPTLNNVNPSDKSLQLEWGSLTGVTTEVTYEFYCVPNEAAATCKSLVLESFGAKQGTSSTSSGGTGGTTSTTGSTGTSSAGGKTSTGSGGATATGTTENVSTASAALEDGTAGSAGTSGLDWFEIAGTAGTSGAASLTAFTAGKAGSDATGSAAAGATNLANGGGAGVATSSAAAGATELANGGSAGTATGSTSTAVPDVITPIDPQTLSAWHCGSKRGRLSSSGYTDASLVNKQSYAVALAVRDTYGNLGSLSNYVCGTPIEIETFFEHYRAAGGEGGGGFCNLDIHPRRSTLPAIFGALGVAAWLRRRHRRLPRRSKSSETP
jgi:hypothetical protein